MKSNSKTIFFALLSVMSLVVSEKTGFNVNNQCSAGPVVAFYAKPNPNNNPKTKQGNSVIPIASIELNYFHLLQNSVSELFLFYHGLLKKNQMLSQVSGVVFQGGSMKFDPEVSAYTKTAFNIIDYAKANPKFVVFGVCNGFQNVTRWVDSKILYKNKCHKSLEGVLLPAKVVNTNSKMLKGFTKQTLIAFSRNSTANFHLFSVKTGLKGKFGKFFSCFIFI